MLEKNKLKELNIKELTVIHNLEKNLLSENTEVSIYIDPLSCDKDKIIKIIKESGYSVYQDKAKFECEHIYIVK